MSRRTLGRWLRRLADRIDRHGAPKATGLSFTFEPGIGRVIHHGNGVPIRPRATGCTLWYLGDDEYERAHTDAGKGNPRGSSTILRHPQVADRRRP